MRHASIRTNETGERLTWGADCGVGGECCFLAPGTGGAWPGHFWGGDWIAHPVLCPEVGSADGPEFGILPELIPLPSQGRQTCSGDHRRMRSVCVGCCPLMTRADRWNQKNTNFASVHIRHTHTLVVGWLEHSRALSPHVLLIVVWLNHLGTKELFWLGCFVRSAQQVSPTFHFVAVVW